jgi:hypothetical protein
MFEAARTMRIKVDSNKMQDKILASGSASISGRRSMSSADLPAGEEMFLSLAGERWTRLMTDLF